MLICKPFVYLCLTVVYFFPSPLFSATMKDPARDTIACSSCPWSYRSQIYLFRHIRRLHHDEYETQKKPSVYCENTRPRRSACSQPEFPEILQANITPGQKGTHQSSNTEEQFTHQNHLDLPGHVYAREKPFYCSPCGKNFVRTISERICAFTRERCSAACSVGRVLSERVISNYTSVFTREKPYQCSRCCKSFNQTMALLKDTRALTQERSCIRARTAGRVLASWLISKHTSAFTQERSRFTAPTVGGVLVYSIRCSYTSESTQERNRITALTVGGVLIRSARLNDTIAFTCERSLVTALRVGGVLVTEVSSRHVSTFTQMRSRMMAGSVLKSVKPYEDPWLCGCGTLNINAGYL
ncbi:zinc finger protein 180-like [Tachysurus fulvidraco]|uniref:zinc finger protein 180-like n=1 Tax=Tachysurus fulvidraco TaxID=1234273 RepID=UPI001FED6426|nr:zinc finger protein 180-like [Tachysurus fulvidraco]XP_047672437.1 zinc finger protein 180-like [Tachysurus fulvidraco]